MRELNVNEMEMVSGGWGCYYRRRTSCSPTPSCTPTPPPTCSPPPSCTPTPCGGGSGGGAPAPTPF